MTDLASDKACLEESSEEAEARKSEAGGKCTPGPQAWCEACKILFTRELTPFERKAYLGARTAYHRSTMIEAVPYEVVLDWWLFKRLAREMKLL